MMNQNNEENVIKINISPVAAAVIWAFLMSVSVVAGAWYLEGTFENKLTTVIFTVDIVCTWILMMAFIFFARHIVRRYFLLTFLLITIIYLVVFVGHVILSAYTSDDAFQHVLYSAIFIVSAIGLINLPDNHSS